VHWEDAVSVLDPGRLAALARYTQRSVDAANAVGPTLRDAR